MQHLKNRLKKKGLRKQVERNTPINMFIQPFQKMPSISNMEQQMPERINAHDLFSMYRADIINREIVYAR